ncbi:(2,3-dihydroxybenzoyl)adenylate synthase [Symbiopectobacterium purcellii]|uniref:AMP-binding protein n=1 Tax=Symbiopectobacterium purcellii TaxID=2871826 RepID=A0ABX9AQT3_9ENTR|nr:AMP-binding protein [Symbiopectobacterium purcellii]QZN97549.1 AMP-binding protein [Symbiopectobacterium purcellii]
MHNNDAQDAYLTDTRLFDTDARRLPPPLAWPPDAVQRYQDVGYWQADTLSTHILRWQQVYSEHIALIAEGHAWPYWKLIGQGRRFATMLRQHGVSPGDPVLVQLPNGADFAVALFAVLLIGAVPVLVVPTLCPKTVLQVAVQARARRYLGSARIFQSENEALTTQLAEYGCRTLFSGKTDRFCFCQETMIAAPPPGDEAGNIALLLLSGGTTGTPKLIPRTHADYVYNFQRCAELCALSERDRYLAALPMAHNFSLACPGALGVWSRGGCVVVPATPAPEDAFAAIARFGVTLTALVPSLSQCWLEALDSELPDLRSLRLIQVGGAKLDANRAGAMLNRFGCQLQQVFGMAEGLITATRLDDTPHTILTTQGRPLCEDDDIRIVDPAGNAVSPGDSGELWVRGPYTIRGYFRVRPSDMQPFTSEGFYRSGDRVRCLPDGNLCVEGRIKETINRHGESVAAGDIEDALRLHPAVRDVAVVTGLDETVHAVVVAKRSLLLADLCAFLEQQGVPLSRWPDALSVVKTLPLTPMGKINKQALTARLLGRVKEQVKEQP